MIEKNIDSIKYLLKQAKEKDKPKPIIFLGAGASISAGIPGANRIKDDILERFRDKPEIKRLTERIPEKERTYYDLMKCLNPMERHELLRGYITDEKVKINVSHIYLANLLKLGYVDYILTVNFDDLLLRACALFNFLPPVYDIAILKDFTTTTLQEKSVTYLHGQHNGFWLLNTKEELKKVRISVPKILDSIRHGRTWIVIGYSGEDPIFDHIAKLGRFDNDLFWVGYKENEPTERVRDKLLDNPNTNAYWVTGHDADSFFLKLHSELKLETPEIFNKPFSFLKSMIDKVVDIKVDKVADTEDQNPYREVGVRLKLTKEHIDEAIQSFEENTTLKTEELQDKIKITRLKQEIIEKIVKEDYSNVEEIEDKVRKINEIQLSELLSVLYYNWGTDLLRSAMLIGDEHLLRESLEKYKEATELIPKFDNAFDNWGVALLELAKLTGDKSLFKESLEKHKKAAKLNPNHSGTFNNWGNTLSELAKLTGDKSLFKESLEKFEKAAELNPKYSDTFNNWGNTLSELAKLTGDESLFEESLEKFEKAIELDSSNATVLNNWGSTLFNLGKLKEDKSFYRKGIKRFEKAIELNPKYTSAYTNWGNALSELAKLEKDKTIFRESFTKYEKATILNPEHINAYNYWATALINYSKLFSGEDAVQYLMEAKEKAEQTIALGGNKYNLACIHALLKAKEKALALLDECLASGQITKEHVLADEDWKAYWEDADFKAVINN